MLYYLHKDSTLDSLY